MPYYAVKKKTDDTVHNLPKMSYGDLQKFLNENPEYEVVINSAPAVKVN